MQGAGLNAMQLQGSSSSSSSATMQGSVSLPHYRTLFVADFDAATE